VIRSANAASGINRRTITFAIAAVLAIGTGLLTFSYLTSMNRNVSVAAAPRLVVVAQHDIPARATITLDMLAVTRRPADAVDPDSLTAPSAAVGSIARVSIPAGSAVTSSMIGRAFDTGLTERIPPGMRAISIPIDKVKGVANLIQAGDHVDVIALTRAQPGISPQALTILKNVVVLAIGSTYETTDASATPSPDMGITTATLRVTPKQAGLLALADVNTTLRLDLREPKERSGAAPPDPLVLVAPEAPVSAVQTAPVAAPAAAAPARPAPERRGVEVIDGDQLAGAK
jgi:pilus assembly protein CpaB